MAAEEEEEEAEAAVTAEEAAAVAATVTENLSIKMTRHSRGKIMLKNAKRIVSTIKTIPRELSSDIMARVAANSLTDITNVKLSCKILNEIAEDSYVYQNVSLKKFRVVQWKSLSKEETAFLNKCSEFGNPEFLYRKGVVDYFSRNELDSAYECLRKAASQGHVGALYVICIIFLFSNDQFKQRGITILSEMKKSRAFRRKSKHCRRNLIEILREIWENGEVQNMISLLSMRKKDQLAAAQSHRLQALQQKISS
ncbi:F-box family protein [Abeliophyllum distichum]|uniref:F-box family protein n=1 Tax=Abeliophyllum distichum TaxID=126358 RepID=A0ABD1SZI5_9LAMI